MSLSRRMFWFLPDSNSFDASMKRMFPAFTPRSRFSTSTHTGMPVPKKRFAGSPITDTLKLQMDGVSVGKSLTCKATLTSDSYIKNTLSGERLLPIDMKVSHSFLSKISSNVILNNYHKVSLYYPLNSNESFRPSLPFSMTFKVIFDFTNHNQYYLEQGNLHATTWI